MGTMIAEGYELKELEKVTLDPKGKHCLILYSISHLSQEKLNVLQSELMKQVQLLEPVYVTLETPSKTVINFAGKLPSAIKAANFPSLIGWKVGSAEGLGLTTILGLVALAVGAIAAASKIGGK